MTISQWANNFLKLPRDSAEPGQYKTTRTPYVSEIMDAFNQPNVKKIVVKSSSQVGKALALDTPIPTPAGFKAMSEIEIGDKVFDERGEVCNVIGVSEIFYNHDCYKLTFSDGAEIVADSEHLWQVQEDARYKVKESILTTEEISRNFKKGKCNRYAIPVAKSLKLPKKDLPVDPAAWLGDGDSNSAKITMHQDDIEIAEKIKSAGHNLGVLNNKHIPEIYLRASYEQRLEFLRGLLDTAGYIDENGRCEITQKSKVLAENIFELLQTLGLKPTLAVCTNSKTRAGSETERRRIVNVEKVASVPTKCIAVDSTSHLYLAGKNFIPTHNSQMLLAIVGYYVHLNPCNIMIIQPTLETAEDFSKSRLQKMIQDTSILTPLFSDFKKSRNANQTILSKFYTGGRIVLVGANSPAGLASRPIKILLCDETDRYPASVASEGDPILLAEKRQTTYWDYKTGLFSTPTVEGESRIDAEYLLGTQEEWRHACPNCGEYHCLDYRNMAVDYEENFDEFKNKTIIVKSVKWRCPDCGQEFTEIEMKNSAQRYEVKNADALKNNIRSFFINGFASPWVDWKTIMTEWLTAKNNPARESVVYNTRFGLSYKLTGEYNDENYFLNRREDYLGELPDKVLILTAAVDVQSNRLEYLVNGWGIDEECYGIERGIIRGQPNDAETWQQLDIILNREYKYQTGAGLKIARTFIDSGYATASIYAYCQQNQFRGVFPIKGTGLVGAPLIYKYFYPKNYNVIVTILGVNDGKQEIFSRLGIEKPGSQYLHFPRNEGRGFDVNFFKQLIAEKRVVRKSGGVMVSVWEPIAKRIRNESLDLSVYNLAAIKSLIDKDAEFWQKLQKNRYEVKPVSVEKRKVKSRSVEIW